MTQRSDYAKAMKSSYANALKKGTLGLGFGEPAGVNKAKSLRRSRLSKSASKLFGGY